jgi:hypothetical protein
MVKQLYEKSEKIRENPVKPNFFKTPENPRKTKRMPVFTTVILFCLRDPVGILGHFKDCQWLWGLWEILFHGW